MKNTTNSKMKKISFSRNMCLSIRGVSFERDSKSCIYVLVYLMIPFVLIGTLGAISALMLVIGGSLMPFEKLIDLTIFNVAAMIATLQFVTLPMACLIIILAFLSLIAVQHKRVGMPEELESKIYNHLVVFLVILIPSTLITLFTFIFLEAIL